MGERNGERLRVRGHASVLDDANSILPLLAVENLTVRFGGRGASRNMVQAVTDVSFQIRSGESLGLIGESGSGKSTIARAVARLLHGERVHVSGAITLAGVRLDRLSRRALRRERHRMQMIFQDPNDALDPRMTIRRSIEQPVRILRRSEVVDLDAAVDAALEAVGLSAAIGDRRPHELSGGQRQRVNIARALILEPQLLLCDEVVSALDVSIQADILSLLAGLRLEREIGFLFISHDLGVVASICDRVGVMYLGRIVELGTTEQVINDPRHPYTAALLSAEPEPVPRSLRSRDRIILKGDIPSPVDPPSGCGFRTRCPYAEPRCADDVPALMSESGHHLAACHFADELNLRDPAVPR